METNRIDLFFGLAGKGSNAKGSDGSGGFADMLFGVMSKRAGGAVLDQGLVKPAPTLDLPPLAQRPLFEHDRASDADGGKRRDADTLPDRRADCDQATRGRRGDGDALARPSSAQGENVVNHPRLERKIEHALKQAHGDQGTCDAVDDGALDAAGGIDGSGETEMSDDGQELGLGSGAGQGDSLADGETGEDLNSQPTIVALPAAIAAVEPGATTDLDAPGSVPAVPGAAIETTEPTAEPDQAAIAAAAAAIADGADIALAEEGDTPPLSEDGTAVAAQTAAPTEKKGPITFLETTSLSDASDLEAAAQGQAAAVESENQRQLEDGGSSFRRNAGNARRAAANGQGATDHTTQQQSQANQATAAQTQATAIPGGSSTAASSTAPAGLAPIGFDTGLGNVTGLPGWNLHLAQGAAARRGDFVANLRQHLQNLPVHDQVALSIQRSLRDGGGSITLQLSPTELGRINLKLNIDEENNVQAQIMVERPATLDLLQRDMKALERALQEAGLKSGPGDLSFSLQGGDPENFCP
ncbi:MAG: flagellar hook-length control protein FliK [Rhodospirillaceae bacterium]|nr:flagellar hook-length control protein FliK [Rhodospirillaceae bacterium]